MTTVYNTIISNYVINDPRLGLEELAIFAHLSSKPDDGPEEIAARFKIGIGRVRKAIKLLVECGSFGHSDEPF